MPCCHRCGPRNRGLRPAAARQTASYALAAIAAERGAAAEGDDAPGPVADREQHAAAEIIIGIAAAFGPAQQAALDQQRLGEIGGQRAAQRVTVASLAGIRGPAQAEAADRLFVEAAR